MYPLSGIKVVELATVVAAPTAARVLCDFGADVIKIESLKGDDMRSAGNSEHVPCTDDYNPLFTITNSNKKLIAINLKTAEGKELLKALLQDADVFITNIRLRSLERLGLDYPTLSQEFPRLVYAHFSGYGTAGPDAQKPGFDSTAFWLRNGPVVDWQTADAYPFYPSYAFGDLATSSAFLSGILMALLGRDKTGRGTLVKTSLLSSGIWCNGISAVSSQSQFGGSAPLDPIRPPDPFSAVYRCADGRWIGFYCNNYDNEIEKFARIFGIEDILTDERWQSVERLHATDAIAEAKQRMNEIFLQKDSGEWARIFTENNVSYEIAYSAEHIEKDEQAWANGYLEEVSFGEGRRVAMPTPPIQFADFERRSYTPTGALGSDTDEILRIHGYSAEAAAKLKELGCIR